MGALASNMLCEEEIEELKETTVFTPQEIKILYERFKFLDRSNVDHLTYNELMLLPEFLANPLSNLALNAIEEWFNYEEISFPYFLEILQIFSKKTRKDVRCKFIFRALDLNKDGRICTHVLCRIYKCLYGDSCDHSKMMKESKNVLKMYDKDNKGYMNYDDFIRFYDDQIDRMMIINFCSHGNK